MTSKTLEQREKSIRRTLYLCGILFFVSLLVFVGSFIVRARTVDDTLRRIQIESTTRDLKICELDNHSRDADKKTWEFLLALFPEPTDVIEVARKKAIIDHINIKDAPRNCLKELKITS